MSAKTWKFVGLSFDHMHMGDLLRKVHEHPDAGLEVVAVCDINRAAAEKRQAECFPRAAIETEAAKLLARDDIDVVDVALHVEHRVPVVAAALEAGKHVLSQKPFALDLVFRALESAETGKAITSGS